MSGIELLDPDLRRQRRAALARHPSAMGIDDVEVAASTVGRIELLVVFVPGEGSGAGKAARPAVAGPVAPAGLAPANVRILEPDGTTAHRLRVLALADAADRDDAIVVTVAVDGETQDSPVGTFILELVAVPGLDPFFAAAPFRLVPERGGTAAGPTATPADPRRRDRVAGRRLPGPGRRQLPCADARSVGGVDAGVEPDRSR